MGNSKKVGYSKRYRSILMTISRNLIIDKGVGHYVDGYRRLMEDFEASDGIESFFWLRMSQFPVEIQRQTLTHVHLVIENKIRFKAQIFEFREAPSGYMVFDNGRVVSGKNWVLLYNFVPTNKKTPMQGFQGFRYHEEF